MKNTCSATLRKLASLVFAVILLLTTFSVSSFAEVESPNPTKENVVILGAEAGDAFSAYHVIEITYDGATNTLHYDWTEEVKTALTAAVGSYPSVEAFAGYTKTERQNLLAKIADILVNGDPDASIGKTTAVKTNMIASNEGKTTFEGLEWGEYLIVPTVTTSVYEIMLGVVQPTRNDDGTGWTVAQGMELNVKKSDGPEVSKTTPDENVGLWTVIPYTIESSIPKYDATSLDKTFTIKDQASAGLNFKGNLKVYGVKAAGDDQELTLSDVTLSANTTVPADGAAGFTLVLDFDYDQISTYDYIKVTYDAQINDSAVLKDPNSNTVTLEYSNYPYVENSHETVEAEEEVYTYGIKLFKYDGSSATGDYAAVTANPDAVPLQDVIFDIYRPAESGDTDTVTLDGITGSLVKFATITSDATGYASIKDLKAGTYYLIETQAPSGYNLLTDPIAVSIDATSTDDDGYVDTLVANSSGVNLPQTGGIGTMIFTVSGIALMAGAVILLLVLKKKKGKSAE